MPSDNNLPEIKPEDPIIGTLKFKSYRNSAVRRAEQYLPAAGEPSSKAIRAPWGDTMMVSVGDYIVSEIDNPEDRWPVEKSIFERTYVEIEPNKYQKKELIHLVPLTDLTGSPDQKVIVHTLEGNLTVRAGDFYLARGIEGEIWPFPKEKVEQMLVPVDE